MNVLIIAIIAILTGRTRAETTRWDPVSKSSKSQLRGKKKNKMIGTSDHWASSGKASKRDAFEYSDPLCEKFCDDFFLKCQSANTFFNPVHHGGRRRLVETAETPLPRADNLWKLEDAIGDCRSACMLWPRPKEPDTYSFVDQKSEDPLPRDQTPGGFGGDTFWCRDRHLGLVEDPNNAAFHCYHASAPGGAICRDSLVNGRTPYELLRDGQPTRRRHGHCDVALDDTVAECTDSGVTVDNLGDALQMLPRTTEVIFLSGNNIEHLQENVFMHNLRNPSIVQAIYVNDSKLKTIHQNALNGMPDLKIFDASGNSVSVLPEDLLQGKRELLQFSMWSNKFTGAVPQGLFRDTKKLERMMLYGNDWDVFPDGTFDGLTNLEIMSWADTKLVDNSFSDDVFDDLHSLQWFDIIQMADRGRGLKTAKARWFQGGMGKNLLRLAMWGNPDLDKIEDGVFDNLDSIEMVYFHDTKLTRIDDLSQLENKLYLEIITVGNTNPPKKNKNSNPPKNNKNKN